MEEQTIPVPAEALRQAAKSATNEVQEYRQLGHKHSATRREKQIAEAYEALNGADGEFVSVKAGTLSGLTAAARYTNETRQYINCCRHYLKQYKVW